MNAPPLVIGGAKPIGRIVPWNELFFIVKIDKSLIDNILRNDVNTDFVKSIIYMGHLMDAEVIAEGVEHDNQVECLKTLDCDFIQGYIWGRPMEYDEARELAFGAYDQSR